MIYPITALLFCGWLLISLTSYTQASTVIIVIDDIGHSYELGEQAINLPGPINVAILPHSPNTLALAELAHAQGKEILLHVPMTTIDGTPPGPGELSPKLNRQQFINTLNDNLANVPHVNGVNNHMGSLLTQMPRPMSWLMEELKQRQLYFLDSRTSAATVAQQQAQQLNIPNLKRDVFLDNHRSQHAIAQQFEKLLQVADQNGVAVAIGHPYPETIAVLQHKLPALALRGYQQQFVSAYLSPAKPRCRIDKPLAIFADNRCPPFLSNSLLNIN